MTKRFALIGAGVMGRNHARVLSNLSGVEFVAVVDPQGVQLKLASSVVVATNIRNLSALEVDAAIVATPTITHEEISLELADLGMSVLVEKPVAETPASAEKMASEFLRKDLVGAVGHIERFNPAIRELKRRLAGKEIGEVYQIATRRQGSFPHRIGDVGVAKDLATHDIDLTSWVSGSEYEHVYGEVAHKSGRLHEDMIIATGKLRNDILVNHVVNWLSPMKERMVIVTGDKGTFVANTLTGDLTLHENGVEEIEWESFASFRGVTEGNVTRFAFSKKEPLIAELEGFRDAVANDGDDFVSFAEGLQVLRVAEGIVESARSGQRVTFYAR
jgi:UDP-N-acetylglucosamine 3-dehydrogenase